MSNSWFNTAKIPLLVLTFLVSPYNMNGDAFALDPRKAITQYAQDVWQDELPQNTVLAITQTRDGYIWIGTYEGLVRFDGTKFTTFDNRNTKEIKSNAIFVLYEDGAGTLWIGTNDGLCYLKNGKFFIYTTKDGMLDDSVRAICGDRAGNLWVGTDRGLNKFKDGKFIVYTTGEGLSNNSIRAIFEDRAGNLWIGTSAGLSRLKDEKFTVYSAKDGPLNSPIRAIYEDRSGNLLIGTNGGGLFSFKDGKVINSYTTRDGLSNNFVYQILEDRDGNLWLATNGGGLCRFRDGKFKSYTTKDGLLNDLVRSIYEDREGSLWVGTNGGLNRLKDTIFTSYTTREGLSNDNVRTLYENRDGSLWIGTDGGGICRFKDGVFTTFTTKDGLVNDGVRAFFEDHEGTIWIGTTGGLSRLKDGRFTNYSTKNGLSNDFVYSLCEDRAGNLWVGTAGGGLNRFRDGQFTVFTTKDGFSNSSVRAIYEDRDGNLWFGTTGGGLYCFKGGKFNNYTMKDGLSNDNVLALYEDRNGDLWIGTNGGLNRFKGGKFRAYTTKEGLFDNTAFQILEDGKENLWISSNRGIFRVSKKDLDSLDRGAIKSFNCVVFGKADGMGANQCNGASQPAGCRTSDGRLWFPTIKGVSMIDPENIKFNSLPPPMVIDLVIADDQLLDLSKKAILSPGMEKFEFHYAGLSFLTPHKVKFRYKLEGFDKEWVEADVRRTAYYTNIPPGDYQFRVIACNNDGVWNEKGASYSFLMPPPLWRTWWAYLLYIISIVGIGYGGVRFRLETLHRRNDILEAKVAERTAELAKKNEELAGKNSQLDKKNDELANKNEELIQLHQRADRIFSALAKALPGTIIDEKYRLDEKIGSGGFGAVYRATHLVMQRPIAVKVFKPAPGNDSDQSLKRFQLEAVSACRINHPNAVAVFDSGVSSEGIAYLVMELLNGHSLMSEMREKKVLSVQRCSQILLPVCDVLSKAHAAGIIHRDIKPDNIFLHQGEEGEVVKLVDFGIAKLMESFSNMNIMNLTATGGFIGTPTYMSPERFDNKPYDGKSDVYSLGVMLYEMLCGRVPFEPIDGNIFSIMIQLMSKSPRPLSELNPNIPEAIEAAVIRALNKDPERRPTANELAEEFAAASGIDLNLSISGSIRIKAYDQVGVSVETIIIDSRTQETPARYGDINDQVLGDTIESDRITIVEPEIE
jgi:ligand-binding sensor domain-containing protein/serine/threonine protein kinase